jgi:penicillin-binding protein 1C
MPDNQDPRDMPEDSGFAETEPEPRRRNLEDDVPFKLPRAEDLAEEEEARKSDPPLWDASNHRDKQNMPTMPIPREPGVADPKKTLPGSGGLDPNPDFDNSFEAGHTVQHQPPVQRQPQPTLLNMRPYEQQTQQVQPPQQYQQYQRPQYVPPSPPQQTVPQAPALPQRQPKRKTILGCSPTCLMVFGGILASFCGGLTLISLIVVAVVGPRLEDQWASRLDPLDSYEGFQSTFLYDRNGTLLYEAFGEGRRTRVDYAQFPQSLIDATLAIEDDNFFTNPGIDVPATLRAFAQYVGLAQGETGGSTITQQLVRNVLFDFEYRAERSVQRKAEEIALALILTQRKSKEDILEMYLNEIYYGNLAYGAQAAANAFFDKDVNELTLGEAALLAGLPQAPADLDPLSPDPNIQADVDVRWRTVLDRMVTEGFITDDERRQALAQGLNFVEPEAPLRAPHFTVYAQQELERLMTELGYGPEEIARGGLQVYTTVDLRVNNLVQQAVREQVESLAGNNVGNGAALVLKPITGEIIAMVGSADYNNDDIDGRVNVTIAPRQPGSTMKPFTYSAAIEQGMTSGDVIWDTRTTIGIPGQPGYTPVNYDGAYHGPVRMRSALANSFNIPAVQTLRSIGVDTLLAFMERMGVQSLGLDSSIYGLSLTLGGGEITLLELTRGYTVFANQGSLVQSTAILCILDNEDNIIYQYEGSCPRGNASETTVNRSGYGRQALDPRIAFLMSDILSDNPARTPMMGSNSPLNTGSLRTAVKTGTTNDFKDNWTVGYTRNVAVGVWVGNSRGEPMNNVSGLTGAAPIWNRIITSIYADQSLLEPFAVGGGLLADQFDSPGGMSLREMCDIRQLRDPATGCPATSAEWFLDGPAGIPDADGNLQYYEQPLAQQPGNNPNLVMTEPGIYQALVFRLAPEISSQISFSVPPGEPIPPSPIYCRVPPELTASAAGAQAQYFIAPPPVQADAAAAEEYARANGLAFLPTIDCSPDLLVGGGGAAGGFGPPIVTAVITQPQPGQVLSGETPVLGTVQFSGDQADFYKIEIIGGQFPDWTTIGSTHGESVVNGQLESLYVPALQPGSYRMRLVLVKGAGFVQTPYEVPFVVP